MSTIKITFQTQPLDFSPLDRGLIDVVFNNGAQDILLTERLRNGVSYQGFFSEVAWASGSETSLNAQQANNFALAFNRDYKNVGGTKNLGASVTGNEVTITARTGTFGSGSQYTGNVLVVGGFQVSNTQEEQGVDLNLVRSLTEGNCSTIEYNATATNGTAPYVLQGSNGVINSSWDGTSLAVNLERGVFHEITVTDSQGSTDWVKENTPRTLRVGEFKAEFIAFPTYSDVTIRNLNPVLGTTPLNYSLTDENAGSSGSFQVSNSFPGILVGRYRLWIRDAYGCEISKIIEVKEFQGSSNIDVPPFFLIPEANALIFSEKVDFGGDVRKNYFNTTSRNERSIGRRHQITQPFFEQHDVATRFLSSFPYHIVTLSNCDGTKRNIPVATVQTNLGTREKIDAVLFNIMGSIGVYFNGGNEYEPDTETVIGANEIDGGTPSWGITGQLIFIDGIGAKTITGEGFDESRGYYFTVDGTTTDDLPVKIQTTYNKHDYNLFDFFLYMEDVSKTAKIEVQYGYDFDTIVGTYISEVIEKVEDDEKWHLIKYGDEKNRGDMVYQSFPQPFLLLKGKFDAIYPNNSDTSRGDSKTYSLEQESFLGFSFKAGSITAKMANKLTIASGTGFFEINGIRLIKNAEASITNFGNTNLKIWSCEFGYGGNQLGLKSDEPDVLDVSSGTIGGGNNSSDSNVYQFGPEPVYDGKTRYIDGNGNLVRIDGSFASVD